MTVFFHYRGCFFHYRGFFFHRRGMLIGVQNYNISNQQFDNAFDIWSPFQRQLTILQNAINHWHTLRDNFSDPHAETLSQTGVSCSYVLCVIIEKDVCFQRHFYDNKKRLIFYSKLNFGDTNS